MTKSLDDTKEALSNKYLGKFGIHSVGISRELNAVRIYIDPDTTQELADILSEIEKDAAPYQVLPIKSDRPSATKDR